MHGREAEVHGDSGYTGADKPAELQDTNAVFWIAEKPSKLRAIKSRIGQKHARRWEHFRASVRVKVEHPFREVKRQFGYTKARYRGLAKSIAQMLRQFALSNLGMARQQLLPKMWYLPLQDGESHPGAQR